MRPEQDAPQKIERWIASWTKAAVGAAQHFIGERDFREILFKHGLPWSEIPHVKARRDAGETVKFSFCVNDSTRGPTMELAMNRSVSKPNSQAFHPDWAEHWANELEFAFER